MGVSGFAGARQISLIRQTSVCIQSRAKGSSTPISMFSELHWCVLATRELHDRLLNEVLEADPNQDGFVLTNVMAQKEAAALLAEADDFF